MGVSEREGEAAGLCCGPGTLWLVPAKYYSLDANALWAGYLWGHGRGMARANVGENGDGSRIHEFHSGVLVGQRRGRNVKGEEG